MGKTFKGKAKVKAKIQKAKRKIARKVKGMAGVIALLGLVWAIEGCMDTNPASRATSNAIGDVEPTVKVVLENSSSNTVNVTVKTTFGDGAIASADSTGSTETQTATPSMSIPVRIDARYNDAIAGATSTSKGILDTLTEAGAAKVLSLMASGGTGTVQAEKKDGTTTTIKCENGQCYPCTDGNCTP